MASKGARATAGKVSKKGAGPQAKAAPQPEARPAAKKAAKALVKAKAAPAKAVVTAPKIASKAKSAVAKKDAAPKAAKPPKAAPAKAAAKTEKAAAPKAAAPKAAAPKAAAPKAAAPKAAAPKADKKAAAPKADKKAAAPKADKKAAAPKADKKAKAAPEREAAPAAPKAKKARGAKAEASSSNGQSSRLEIGDSVPDVELVDHDGNAFSLGSLAGQSYVLYFYPKDDTPGCTREACAFRDDIGRFEGANVRVVGVSPDKPESHVRFRDKYGLPFTLLSDADKLAANAFGVWVKKQNYGREYMGIERSTFLVDESGKVKKVWRNVKVDGHSQSVLDASS